MPASQTVHSGAFRARRSIAAALVCAFLGLREARADGPEPTLVEQSSEGLVTARRVVKNDVRGSQLDLEFSIEVASAYVFRGYNVFQDDRQREQKWVERPRFVWAPSGTGVFIGYASANQLTGDNLVGNVAAGLGAEQDLFAGYEFGKHSRLGVSTEIEFVAYPVADGRVAGTTTPLFVSLSAEPRYRHTLYVYAGYLRGLGHGPLGDDQFYINPRVEKRFNLGGRFALELEVGGGIKIFQLDVGVVRNNMFDVLAAATLYCALNDVFYVGARVGWAWTNLAPSKDPDTGQFVNTGFREEYVPFWALSVGAEFAAGAPAQAGTLKHRVNAL